MVPNFIELTEIASEISSSKITGMDYKIIFYTDQDSLIKLDKDFFKRTNPGTIYNKSKSNLEEINITLMGIHFTYKLKEE